MLLGDHKPSVVGVCETWLQPHLRLRLGGYVMFRCDRPQGRGGGLLLGVRGDMQSAQIPITSCPGGKMEVLAVRLALTSGWISVLLCYNPCMDVPMGEFTHYLDQPPAPAFVIGDFNARHHQWDPDMAGGPNTTLPGAA